MKQDSPRPGSGAYAKSWTSKVEYEDHLIKGLELYNRKHYQRTHLLEYGHAKVGGGRVAGIPHIKPNEEKAIEELGRRQRRQSKMTLDKLYTLLKQTGYPVAYYQFESKRTST